MKAWFKTGAPWVWCAAGGVSISLIAVIGLLWLIASQGLSYFWPSPVHQFVKESEGGHISYIVGEIYDREQVPAVQLAQVNLGFIPEGSVIERILVKTGNREINPLDFQWLYLEQVTEQTLPNEIAVIERRTLGNFYGVIEQILLAGKQVKQSQLPELLARAEKFQADIDILQKDHINDINYQLERLRRQEREYILTDTYSDNARVNIEEQQAQLLSDYQKLEEKLLLLRSKVARDSIIISDKNGQLVEINLEQILTITFNNQLTFWNKLFVFFNQLASFLSEGPREANTEGGVFPAIFGTVLMVLLMTVIVSPFGVVAAVYLHEYAGKNAFTKLLRIAVINLAGVPSIVYGVFGLGFFVYMVGGSLDNLFYSENLPNPTFGTPGVLWSALTLAILTLPVVIVSTEEGLARIPREIRDGSMALGATKAETIWRIILPIASPAIMTGIILAIARAAGEVAPLMLVGVVKAVPALPIDGNFPFLHLERKFMHLGFHIYDVGFQSPNVEAARPLVYATALLLVMIIVVLNLSAVFIRNRLREKYNTVDH